MKLFTNKLMVERFSILIGRTISSDTFACHGPIVSPIDGRIKKVKVTGRWPNKLLTIFVDDKKGAKSVCIVPIKKSKLCISGINIGAIQEFANNDSMYRTWYISNAMFASQALEFALFI
jgi:hypothetical protein